VHVRTRIDTDPKISFASGADPDDDWVFACETESDMDVHESMDVFVSPVESYHVS
jgi:hypothetical protein